ncbi:hypothetical protein MalM25_27190 [Planctomycetes bacterium MalM25]|nr:hypothetical protein MalM25_27190 [Planctomycetes bacterium MalM25]
MRFGKPAKSRSTDRPAAWGRRGPSLRLAALLAGLLLVLAAQARLGQPETHRALGRVLGEETAATVAPPSDQPALVPAGRLGSVTDNTPFRDQEQDAWFEVIAALQATEPETLAAQSLGAVGYAAFSSQPEAYRGRVVGVAGTVRRVEAVTPAENELGVEQLWRVTLEPRGGEVWPITVYTLEAPRDATEPYDASAVGVFFKKLSYRWAEGVGVTPVILARRLEVTLDPPSVTKAAPALAANEPEADFDTPESGSLGRALLSDLGFDLTTFDDVTDRQPLASRDGPAFYGMLGVVAKTPPAQLVRLARVGLDDYAARRLKDNAGATRRELLTARAIEKERRRKNYSVIPLFDDGANERGELITLDAIVRRAVRVDASRSDLAKENGVDHYYELEAFTEDSQNLPLVFVVRDLPAGFPVGDQVRQPARLAGFFFKQWAYRTRKRADDAPGVDRRQFAPLLIGRSPIPLAAPDPASRRPGLTIGLLATLGLAGVAAALWRLGRRDRRYEATTLSRYRASTTNDELDFDRLDDLATAERPAP